MFRQISRLCLLASARKVTSINNCNTRYIKCANQYLISRHISNEPNTFPEIDLSQQPIPKISDINWPPKIAEVLREQNITEPSRIQAASWPIALSGKDLVGVARTGSGKTIAYILPAFMHIDKQSNRQTNDYVGPTVLVLAPTRELAQQIQTVCRNFNYYRSVCLFGGSSKAGQITECTNYKPAIVIATPGRLIDLMESEIISLNNVSYLVLDEADRMLDMGFEPQIRNIIKSIPNSRQTLMWSATWPEEIQTLAEDFMKNYEYIGIDSGKLKANPNINQVVDFCEPRDKLSLMLKYLRSFNEEGQKARTLIFTNQKRTVDGLLIQLMRNKFRAVGMHGDRSQRDRHESLKLFKEKHCNIMIATDVAARGLDIDDITHVINYDLPNTIEDYIHRIGRTARHEKKGTSVTFFTEENANMANKLITVLKETNQDVPERLEELARDASYMKLLEKKFNNKRRPRNDFYSRDYRGQNQGFSSRGSRNSSRRISSFFDDNDDEFRNNRFNSRN